MSPSEGKRKEPKGSLIVWDARLAGSKHGDGVAARLEEAHSDDMNCVDWNAHDANQIVTGSSDGTIHIYDYRMLASHGRRSIVRRYGYRSDAPEAEAGGESGTAQSRYKLGNITNIMWSPTDGRFFASSGDDGAVTIWDASKSGAPLEEDGLPEALVRQAKRRTLVRVTQRQGPWWSLFTHNNTRVRSLNSRGVCPTEVKKYSACFVFLFFCFFVFLFFCFFLKFFLIFLLLWCGERLF